MLNCGVKKVSNLIFLVFILFLGVQGRQRFKSIKCISYSPNLIFNQCKVKVERNLSTLVLNMTHMKPLVKQIYVNYCSTHEILAKI